MAYQATGTAGNDTLNQSADTGPGTIVGLAGDDCILAGSGLATIAGDTGNDTVVLRAGNTGTVNGGTENDSIVDNGTAIGSMQLFGGDGADTISVLNATGAQTIVGSNDSSDGADSLRGGLANDLLVGNGGNDTLSGYVGSDTMVGGFGNDLISDIDGDVELVFGNQGNDSCNNGIGNDTFYGGLGNDSAFVAGGSPLHFMNEGSDTFWATFGTVTVIGGNDSADGGDSILTGSGADLLFGNGGADTIDSGTGGDTIVAGFGNDTVTAANPGLHLVFGNEGNDTINGAGFMTVFGGLGNNSTWAGSDTDTIQGNEGNDTIRGDLGIDTVAGGAGNDVFRYAALDEGGDNAAGGGPVEFITDVNWAEDRIQTPVAVAFAANMGAGTGVNLATSTTNAIAAANALAGGGATQVAAQFTFGGRTYLAINQDAAFTTFNDVTDLLLDITGVTGTIGASNFTT